MTYTATYSPEDNKLRLYASSRLDSETYQRVKAAGFIWAPKQELFVAPMWTPGRADLLTELAGEIGDEDTSLVDRAEQRAERFEDYGDSRADDANRARDAVSAICDGIPLGQPILVGHHSERHARKDAEKIENGMRRAVKMWEQAGYWKSRAKGAIRAAKYKERPDVRARRIKGLEAGKRGHERTIAQAQSFLKMWLPEGITLDRAKSIANYDWCSRCYPLAEFPRELPASQYEGQTSISSALEGIITPEQAREYAVACHRGAIAQAERWLDHIENRLTYERTMLEESGGSPADRFPVEVGGRVLIGSEWVVVLRVNKSGDRINSVTTTARYVSVRGIEEVKDYRPPEAEEAAKVKAAVKQKPLCNYPGEGFLRMTKAEYDSTVPKWSDFPKIGHMDATETAGAHRVRQTRKPGGQYWDKAQVFLTDVKRVDPPAKAEPIRIERKFAEPAPAKEQSAPDPSGDDFRAIKETLAAGVQVVSAPQLFPTPPELARRMVEEAGVEPADRVLEPSAGTGRILDALKAADWSKPEDATGEVVAVEVNRSIADALNRHYSGVSVHCADFLECNGDLGQFDRILMNPPFANGQDIKHIQHAVKFLKPGGRLVAICANGPRQRETLKPLAENSGGRWEDLPTGTFEQAGTGVNTALLVIEA